MTTSHFTSETPAAFDCPECGTLATGVTVEGKIESGALSIQRYMLVPCGHDIDRATFKELRGRS